MKIFTLAIVSLFWLYGCIHQQLPRSLPSPPPSPVNSDLALWVEYVSSLEAMSSKDLKSESERWRRTSEREWDEDVRYGLVAAVQFSKGHNYQKAADAINQVSSKALSNPDLKNWLRLYSLQLAAVAGLEKELAEEKRQRLELEKKLKALSDIEKDMSERTKSSEL